MSGRCSLVACLSLVTISLCVVDADHGSQLAVRGGQQQRNAAARIGDKWGVNVHETSENAPGEFAMLATAFRVARMDFSWGRIEAVCGQYDFSAYDAFLTSLDAVGVRAYLIIDYSNACYPDVPANSCSSPACVAGYGRLAAAAAAHFKGRGVLWELVNEPNGMGLDSAADIAALAAAAGGPLLAAGEELVGPTTAGFDFPYINASFAAGLLRSVSGVSVHPYRSGAPESAAADFVILRALMTSYGAPTTMPMNGGECAFL